MASEDLERYRQRSIATLPVMVSSHYADGRDERRVLDQDDQLVAERPQHPKAACGRITLRNALEPRHAEARAASHWRWLTDSMPPR